MKARTTTAILAVVLGITMWRISVAGVTTGLITGGHRILPASPVTALAVPIIGIPLAYWVIGRLFGRNWWR
jgi:hypothetical protein